MSRKEAKKLARAQAKLEEEKKFNRDVFLRELKLGQFSVQRREKEWKKMMMKIAEPHMREELEWAWISFERSVDNKDMEIALYLEELRNSENQYSMNFKNHLEHLDEFISVFLGRMNELKAEFNNNISHLEKSVEEDLGGIMDTWKEDEDFLKTVLYMLELTKKDQKTIIQAEFFNKLEEEETKNTQVMQRLEALLEDLHTSIEADTEKFLKEYLERTNKRKAYYEELKAQDDSLRQVLSLQLEKLHQMHDTIKSLKMKLMEAETYLGRRLKELESESQFFNNAYTMLKRRLENDRQTDQQKLEVLTVSHSEAVRHLEKIKQKGEHILHMAAVCRKLETQEEKILPFPCVDLVENHKHDVEERVYIKSLDLFWQKVGQAEASRNALNEERAFLRKENELLQKELHEYCQCLNCPMPQTAANEVLNWTPHDSKLSKNVTDANIELKKYSKFNTSFG